MNLFSKGSVPVAEAITVELLHEPDWYTSGDRVRGQVVVASRQWTQMVVEVLVVCEEQAELNPAECGEEGFESRRLTIAGETVEGEPGDRKCGVFPFELRLLDDPEAPFLLPSFDVDSGEAGLVNAIKWTVEVHVEYKGRMSRLDREIAFIPRRVRPVSEAQQILTQEMALRAYRPGPTPDQPIYHQNAMLLAQLQLPKHGIEQTPALVPLSLSVSASRPNTLAVTGLGLQLVQHAVARIGGMRSPYTVVENVVMPLQDLFVPIGEIRVDLSHYVAGARIVNACSNFTGRWLSITHSLEAVITVCAVHRREYQRTLRVSGPVEVLPMLLSEEHDAPPQYTPPEGSPQALSRQQSFMLPWTGHPSPLSAP